MLHSLLVSRQIRIHFKVTSWSYFITFSWLKILKEVYFMTWEYDVSVICHGNKICDLIKFSGSVSQEVDSPWIALGEIFDFKDKFHSSPYIEWQPVFTSPALQSDFLCLIHNEYSACSSVQGQTSMLTSVSSVPEDRNKCPSLLKYSF
jgi:hypothetical protein